MEKKKRKIPFRELIALNKRALKVMNKYCPGMILSYILYAIVSAIIPYVTVYLSARIIDELAGSRRPEILWRWVIAAVAAGGILSLLKSVLERIRAAKESQAFSRRGALIDKFLSLDYADMDKQTTKDLYAQIEENESWRGLGIAEAMVSFREGLNSIIGIICAATLTVGLITSHVPKDAGMAFLDHPAAIFLLFLAMILPTVLASFLSAKAGSYEQSVAMADEARQGNRIFGAFGFLSGDQSRALDIRIYNQQVMARHYLNQENTFSCDGPFGKLASGKMGILYSLSAGMSALVTGMVYIYVCLKAWAGAFGVGAVTQYVASVTAFIRNISSLLQQIGKMRQNAPFLQMVYTFLDMPNAMYQGTLTTEKRSDREYEVEFRNVSFQYPGSETYALRNVSVKFKVGERLAVVGENGSGKTTFIKLLCRLYDPQEGEILLNGIDIRKYDYRDYMNVFSVVFQDFQLLSQPLGQNVAGSREYDKERVIKSLTDAGFADRLASLPEGLDTWLYREFGEEGVAISGGEAQKIAIARSLYKDAPFIILDEPTAALDPIAEAEIYAQFNEISGDKTAIYISHRLSSCRFCDEILVFDSGQIVERGSHEELLNNENGKYHELWHAQAQYYQA